MLRAAGTRRRCPLRTAEAGAGQAALRGSRSDLPRRVQVDPYLGVPDSAVVTREATLGRAGSTSGSRPVGGRDHKAGIETATIPSFVGFARVKLFALVGS